MATNKRIENLEFRPASYLFDTPEIPAWEIIYWRPNQYYGHENEYEKVDQTHYKGPGDGYYIHESCFEHPETCFTIASFEYNKGEEEYELQFCGNRPLSLSDNEKTIFWDLINYGYNELNDYE